jgi:hypothetical protein|tara:strand:+ start:4606 stop:4941 length:336 start_codon:yes stop_codon:yes gene_type:complete
MEAKPYSEEVHGSLIEYLIERDGRPIDNMFLGSEHFVAMRDEGFLIPNVTILRVDSSPAPDMGYFVNSDFKLEGRSNGESNMSMVWADEGIYDPEEVLEDRIWSIFNFDLS